MSFDRSSYQFSCYLKHNIDQIMQVYPKNEPAKIYQAVVTTVTTFINQHQVASFKDLDKIYASLIEESFSKLSTPIKIHFCSTPKINENGERIDRFVEGFFEPARIKRIY